MHGPGRGQQRIITIGMLSVVFAGVCSLALSIAGLQVFSTAEWFTFAGPFAASWQGYTPAQFAGLTLFTFCSAPAFALLFSASQHAVRLCASRSRRAHVIAVSAAIAPLMALMAFGAYWASDLLRCWGIGCVNDDHFIPFNPPKPEAGMGWQIFVG